MYFFYEVQVLSETFFSQTNIYWGREGAAKLAQLLESASSHKKYMNKNYEKICIE